MNAHALRYVLPTWLVGGLVAVALAAMTTTAYDYAVPSAPDPISGIMSTSNFDFQKLIAPIVDPWKGGADEYTAPPASDPSPDYP